ncbi:hypothetical protein ACWGBX_38050 [Streptomyces sp. NPDC055037]
MQKLIDWTKVPRSIRIAQVDYAVSFGEAVHRSRLLVRRTPALDRDQAS